MDPATALAEGATSSVAAAIPAAIVDAAVQLATATPTKKEVTTLPATTTATKKEVMNPAAATNNSAATTSQPSTSNNTVASSAAPPPASSSATIDIPPFQASTLSATSTTRASSSSTKAAPTSTTAAPVAVKEESGWDWFGLVKKKPKHSDAAPPLSEQEQKEKADVHARAKADEAEKIANAKRDAARIKAATQERERDTLGGTSHPFIHSFVRYGINKFLGFEEFEEGMEERYREVLCRELVTMPTDMNIRNNNAAAAAASSVGSDTPVSLTLEMSHFYPRGCHATPLPVILVRTPYDRALMRHTAERICQHGYHCVIQDTRNSPNAAALRAKQEIAKLAAAATEKKNGKTNATSASSSTSTSTTVVAIATTIAESTLPTSTSLPSLTTAPPEFFPVVYESNDGLATIEWCLKQSWCDGNISFYGASYLGIAQYAVVNHRHPALKCIVPVVSATHVYPIIFPAPGTLNLDLTARWLYIMFHPHVTGANDDSSAGSEPNVPSFWKRSYARVIGSRKVIPKALEILPASELDISVTEKRLEFWREMISNGGDSSLPFWKEKQAVLCDLNNSPPLLIIEGWYDLFLQQALRDYREALQIYKTFQAEVKAGKYTAEELAAMPPSIRTFRPYLTIINCVHIDVMQLYKISLTESIQFFDFHLKKKYSSLVHRPEDRCVRVQMINASASNEKRHLGLVEKRKKFEQKLLLDNQALSQPDPNLSFDLLSPRSKKRYRQNLLDAEWRTFPEFPPPQAKDVRFLLTAAVNDKGEEERGLRMEVQSETEKQDELRRQNQHGRSGSKEGGLNIGSSDPSSSSSSSVASTTLNPSVASITKRLSISVLPRIKLAPASKPLPYSSYVYDPSNPTPAIGGTSFDVENSGPLDNRPMESRSDVLVFTSPPLDEPLVVIGFVKCHLYVRSNRPATDFVARLLDVYPLDEFSSRDDRKAGGGKSQILCDGICKVTPANLDQLTHEKGVPPTTPKRRAGHGDGYRELIDVQMKPTNLAAPAVYSSSSSAFPDLVRINIVPSQHGAQFSHPFISISEPDTTMPLLKIEIDMWATGNVFGVGHRIRFHLCSAAHPRWLRSLGGPDPMFVGLEQAHLQHQTVYHDQNYPSALILPVLPE